MGFLVVSAVLVVSFGRRFGDMFGRVRMYTLGFAIFSIASIFLTVTWMHGSDGALWLIVWRLCRVSAARSCSRTPPPSSPTRSRPTSAAPPSA